MAMSLMLSNTNFVASVNALKEFEWRKVGGLPKGIHFKI